MVVGSNPTGGTQIMEKKHINERGTHTTVIEPATDFIDLFGKLVFNGKKVELSPGRIEGGVGAKSKSVKFKQINNHLYEMVITVNNSRQEFKLFTEADYETIRKAIKSNKRLREWNVNYLDSRHTPAQQDTKYKVK